MQQPRDWQGALAASAAAEAAVVAAMSTLGAPSFPICASPIQGSSFLSQNSVVAPTASCTPAVVTPPIALEAGRTASSSTPPLPQRVVSGSSAGVAAAGRGCLFASGIVRCRFAPADATSFACFHEKLIGN